MSKAIAHEVHWDFAQDRDSGSPAHDLSSPTSLVRSSLMSIDSGSPPRLALVLGSDRVRSSAPIGIAEVLGAEGLRLVLIVGCSSGALFDATIALGMTRLDALQAVTSLWSAELTQHYRGPSYAQLGALKLFGFGAGFALRDDRHIAQRMQRAFADWRHEDSPTPLRVVATGARSGQSVVLGHGPLAQAARASVMVPLVFPSVEVDGRRLVDGVVSEPMPIAVAFDAAVMVALVFKGVMPWRIDRASRLVGQASTALTNNLQQARVAAARNAGCHMVEIELALDRQMGLWETRKMPHLHEAGSRAARANLAQIIALSHQSSPCARGCEALAA
jgi:NTE family protein